MSNRLAQNFSFQKAILMGVILTSLGLRIQLSNTDYLRLWDERFHALVAKDIWKDPLKPMLYKDPVLDYPFDRWDKNHVWLHKPPITLWLLGLSIEVFGNTVWAIRLPSLLFFTMSAVLVFLLGTRMKNEWLGLLAASFFAFNPKSLELVSALQPTDHVDTLFSFFILLGVYLGYIFKGQLTNSRMVLMGLVLGSAYLTKSMPAAVLIPVWMTLWYTHGGSIKRLIFDLGKILFVAILVSLPWIIWTKTSFPMEAAYESEYNTRHLFEVLEGHRHPWYFFFVQWVKQFGPALLLVFWFLSDKEVAKKYLWLIVWILIPFIVFTLAATKMEAYIFITYAGVFILLGLAIIEIWNSKKKWGGIIGSSLIVASCGLLSLEVQRIWAYHKSYPMESSKPPKYAEIPYQEKFVLLNEWHYVQSMYFYGGSVYNFWPSQDQINQALKKGYKVYVKEPKDKSKKAQLEKVTWVRE